MITPTRVYVAGNVAVAIMAIIIGCFAFNAGADWAAATLVLAALAVLALAAIVVWDHNR